MSNTQTTVTNLSQTKQESQNASIISLVLGICGLLFPGIGVILGIIGVIFAKKSRKFNGGILSGMALAGMICSIISIVLGAIVMLSLIAYLLFVVGYFAIVMGLFATATSSVY